MDAYPSYAASALAANTFARCMFAAAFPLFGQQSEWPPHSNMRFSFLAVESFANNDGLQCTRS